MARVKFTEWEPTKYPQRVRKCLELYSPVIGQQFQEEIRKDQFNWPNDTRRKNGQLVSKGPRDIVDLGNFAGSQTPGKVVRGKSLVFEWTAAYALAIFLGYYNNQFQKTKERDWVTPALDNESMLAFFVRTWVSTAK